MEKRRQSLEVSFSSDDSNYEPDDRFNTPSRISNKRSCSRTTQSKNKRRKSAASSSTPSSGNLSYRVPIGGTVVLHSRSSHRIQSAQPLRTALLRWYSGVHASRGMPWRKPYNPALGSEERGQRAYEVWVSEVMLQQTQVATVIPYYTRWIEKFPTIRHLAASTIDEVNSLWKGLGYYSRAKRLLDGAKKAVVHYDGRLPDSAADMEKNIPGIGRYSAGAIASIAYGEHVPVLDGNVHRLLSRLLGVHAPPKSKVTLDILWTAATDFVEIQDIDSFPGDGNEDSMEKTQYPGDINQALIELGSTICKVRAPDCGVCPLRPWCRAFATSKSSASVDNHVADIEDLCTLCEPLGEDATVLSYPMKAERKKAREELDIVNIIEWQSMSSEDRWFLMVRRPEGGLLAGLYEFPTSANVSKTLSQTAQNETSHKLLRQLLQSKISDDRQKSAPADALRIKFIKPIGNVLHIFSHIRKTYRPQWVLLEGGAAPPSLMYPSKHETPTSASWVRLDDVADTNIGIGMSKVWNLVKESWAASNG